jgi:hypothetical protein
MGRSLWVLLVSAMLLLTACAAPITAQSAHFRVGISLDQVGLGKRPVMITVHDLDGQPIDGATVTLLPVMRQHGMLAPPMAVQSNEPGKYLFSEVNLDMSGEWQMQITIEHVTTTDLIEIPVMIE